MPKRKRKRREVAEGRATKRARAASADSAAAASPTSAFPASAGAGFALQGEHLRAARHQATAELVTLLSAEDMLLDEQWEAVAERPQDDGARPGSLLISLPYSTENEEPLLMLLIDELQVTCRLAAARRRRNASPWLPPLRSIPPSRSDPQRRRRITAA